MQEIWIQSLGREDPLQKGVTTHLPTPVFLPGKLHGQSRLVGYESMGSQRLGHARATNTFLSMLLRLLLSRFSCVPLCATL